MIQPTNIPAPERLLNRDFLLLFQGKLTSSLGISFYLVVVVLWLQQVFDSGAIIGLIAMISGLPMLIFGPIGGVFADRHSRKWIMVWCDVAAGVTTFAVCVAMFAVPDRHGLILGLIAADFCISGVAMAFFGPAAISLIPQLAPRDQLDAANGLLQSASELVRMGGQALAGVLFAVISAPWLVLVTSVSFLTSAVTECFIREPGSPKAADAVTPVKNFRREFTEGLHETASIAGLPALILLIVAMESFSAPLLVMLPFYVTEQLGAAPHWFGFLMSAMAGGTVLGGLVMSRVSLDRGNRGRIFIGSLLIIPVAFVGMALTTSPLLAIGCMVGFGVAGALGHVIAMSALQTRAAPDKMARVISVMMTFSAAAGPIAMGVAGLLVDAMDQRVDLLLFGCAGALVLIVVALGGRAVALFEYDRHTKLLS